MYAQISGATPPSGVEAGFNSQNDHHLPPWNAPDRASSWLLMPTTTPGSLCLKGLPTLMASMGRSAAARRWAIFLLPARFHSIPLKDCGYGDWTKGKHKPPHREGLKVYMYD